MYVPYLPRRMVTKTIDIIIVWCTKYSNIVSVGVGGSSSNGWYMCVVSGTHYDSSIRIIYTCHLDSPHLDAL